MKIKITKLPSNNKFSYGGSTNKLGGDFTNNVTFINEGGTHEQNPFEGVPFGVDNEGTPNLVEEGEVIWNDYVFSNRLTPTKKMLENIGFPDKYKDYSFALIAEELQKESTERPNDLISQRGLQDSMQRLIGLQEEVRMKKQQRKQNRFDLGGFVNKFDNGSFLEDGTIKISVDDYIKMLESIRKKELEEEYRATLKDPKKAKKKDIDKYIKSKYTKKEQTNIKANAEKYANGLMTLYNENVANDKPFEIVDPVSLIELDTPPFELNEDLDISSRFGKLFESYDKKYNEKRAFRKASKEVFSVDKTPFDWDKFGNDMLRIGAPIAANISALARNLSKPDYSQNERALNEARTAPMSNIVAPTEDISIRPVDINYMANMLRNQGNATLRNINNTALNEQQALANYMIANNQLGEQIADSYFKANEVNLNRMLQEKEFNRGNDQFKTQIDLQNFANNSARHNAIINATAQAAAANSALDAARAQGIYGSESNLAESLAGVGSENIWKKAINENPALLYTFTDGYKKSFAEAAAASTAGAKYGGKLLTKKRRK